MTGFFAPEDQPLEIGARVLYCGEPGKIVGASPEFSPPPGWWIVELDQRREWPAHAGKILAPIEGSPFLKRLTRKNFLRDVLESVRDRMISVDRAAAIIELAGVDAP